MSKEFDKIYNTYQPKLKTLFNKQLKDKDQTEDLVQETLLKVWKNLDTYNDKYTMSTWVYTIAFNTLKNYYSSIKTHITYSADVKDSENPLSFDSPENLMIAAEQEDSFLKAVGKLGDNFLEVYVLREVEGLSYKGISSQLNVSEGTVKSRLKRSRDYIKKEMSV